jgi:hypothetical protein
MSESSEVRMGAFVILWIILSLVATPIVGALLALPVRRAEGATGGAWRFGRKRNSGPREEHEKPPHTSV